MTERLEDQTGLSRSKNTSERKQPVKLSIKLSKGELQQGNEKEDNSRRPKNSMWEQSKSISNMDVKRESKDN